MSLLAKRTHILDPGVAMRIVGDSCLGHEATNSYRRWSACRSLRYGRDLLA